MSSPQKKDLKDSGDKKKNGPQSTVKKAVDKKSGADKGKSDTARKK
ncbi:hypothetical protein [Aequorivita capsosiphonis]|nr:hypothetical protein [Aequorivita capsosiphonis]